MATNLLSALLAPYWACEGGDLLEGEGIPSPPHGPEKCGSCDKGAGETPPRGMGRGLAKGAREGAGDDRGWRRGNWGDHPYFLGHPLVESGTREAALAKGIGRED